MLFCEKYRVEWKNMKYPSTKTADLIMNVNYQESQKSSSFRTKIERFKANAELAKGYPFILWLGRRIRWQFLLQGENKRHFLPLHWKGDDLIKNDNGFTCFFVVYSVLLLRLKDIPFFLETDWKSNDHFLRSLLEKPIPADKDTLFYLVIYLANVKQHFLESFWISGTLIISIVAPCFAVVY